MIFMLKYNVVIMMKIVFIMSFIYLALICGVYFVKKKIKTRENDIYSTILIVTLFGVIYDFFQLHLSTRGLPVSVLIYFNKIFLIYVIIWTLLFLTYTLNIDLKYKYKSRKYYLLALFICILTILILPASYEFDENGAPIVGGPAVIFDYTVVISLILYMFIAVLRRIIHNKNEKKSKYIPLFLFIFLGSSATLIQYMFPHYLLTTPVETFITILTYFFIENPDLKMMEELYKNKKLIEKTNEDTANFLFRMTQDIKKPIRDIIEVSDDMITIDDLSDLKDGSKIVNNKAKELDYLVNDALDVSLMSTKTIKIYDTRYNPINLFKEIKYQTENKLNNNVKFEYSVSNNIPSYLYGDSIKLKQIIYSILENSVQNTEEGFISLDINSIIKYDVCRLIINISDSGKGISIDEVNNILSLNIEDLAKINLTKEEKILNLKEVKKLTMVLGGNLIVKSEEGKGTTVSITIDQKIVPTKEKEISKKLDLYEQSLQKNKKIMVVDDDTKELSKITSYLENQEMHVSGSLFGRDVIDKIKSKHKFDLIILDDETNTISAYEVLKELKKDENFNIPVVVMIDDNKEFIKLHFMQDGFFDVIMKSKLNSELDRILKRL